MKGVKNLLTMIISVRTDDPGNLLKNKMWGRCKNYFNKAKHISIRNQFEWEFVIGIIFMHCMRKKNFIVRHSTWRPGQTRAMQMTFESIVEIQKILKLIMWKVFPLQINKNFIDMPREFSFQVIEECFHRLKLSWVIVEFWITLYELMCC